ncbi:MAG: branched-chain amino acid ABC transporter substrate-binding protein [Anaerolineae bacterium]|nr:branched-chain amino acid ABC transporter substrate-binding protein [Anaerolineae bacterium]
MNRKLLLTLLLLLSMLLFVACSSSADEEPTDDTTTTETDDTSSADTETDATDTGEETMAGLMDGMSAEELVEAGYVVIAPGDPIMIGASVALTGPIPDPGRDIANGAEVAIDDLNAAGGFMGHEYAIDVQDGACDGDAGTTVANKFASDPAIVAVSGGTCSGETFGLSPILQEARLPFVSPSATNPDITSEDCDTCNRVALSDALQGQVDASYVYNDLGIQTAAVMHDSSDYGLGLAEIFASEFEALGGTVVTLEGVQVGDTDFRAVLTTIATDSPELLFFGGYATEAALIAQQMEEVGMEDAVFFSDDGAYTEQYLNAAGSSAEGSYASFVAGDEVSEANAVFDAAYTEKYGVAPDDLGPFHAQSYDSVQLIANAITQVGKADDAGEGYLIINRDELVAAVRATSDLQGLTGILTCDAIGNCGAGGIQIYQVQNGEFVQVSGFGLGEMDEAMDDTGEEAAMAGLLDGMSAEELMEAGYVVVAPGEPIRIGASVALTGPIPDPGRDIANGAEISIDDLNAAGGLLGHLYELDLQDGACDGDAGTTVANKFASDPTIVAVSGGTCSGETFGLSPILQEARIPFVSPSATNPDITGPDCDTCNRVALSDALQGQVDAAYAFNDLGVTTAAIMHDSSDYGLGLAEIFRTEFEALGGEVVAFEGVQVGDTDFRAVLTLIAVDQPELLFFGGYSTEAGLIQQQMKETGLDNAVFFSDDGAYTQQFLDAAGSSAEGAYASFVAGDEIEDANAAFDAAYEEKYGVVPDDLGPFHGQSYDTVLLIADAIARVAKEDADGEGYLLISREELIEAIRATEGLQGLTGLLTCDAIGNCGAGGIQIFQVQDGVWVQVSGFGME